MKRTLLTGIALTMLTVSLFAHAQSPNVSTVEERQAAMAAFQKKTEVGPGHRQLDYFVGRWNTQLSHHDEPNDYGFAEFTMELGGRHLRQHLVSRMGKTARFEGIGYVGYDNRSKQYYHLWMEDFFSGPFMFVGGYDMATKTYTLSGELGLPYQSYSPKEAKKMQETIRVIDQDHFVIEWKDDIDGVQDDAGMKVEYTRAK